MATLNVRRTLRGILLGIGMLAAATAIAADKKLIITEPSHSIDSIPFYVGMAKGFFKEEGLDISLITSEGGGQHIAAVLSGDADAFLGGPEHIAFAKVKGSPEIRAVIGIAGKANLYFVARKGLNLDPKLPIAENLKGRRIAVGTRGGTGYSLLIQLLNEGKLDPRKDVEIVEIAAAAGRLAAMKAGQVDIASLQEPLISQGVRTGVSEEPFYSFPNDYGAFAWTTLNVPKKLINNDPETVKKLVRAVKKSLEFTYANRSEVAALVKTEFPTMADDDRTATLNRAYDGLMWERDGNMPQAAWNNLLNTVRMAGLLDRDVPYSDVFDLSFVPK